MTADLLLPHDLRPFPGLVDSGGQPLPEGPLRSRMDAVLETVSSAGFEIGPADPDADFEDFWEDALRISGVVDAARRRGLTHERHEAHGFTAEEMTKRLGPVSHAETSHHALDPLEEHPLVLDPSISGRTTWTATYNSELEPIADDDLLWNGVLSELPQVYADDLVTQLRLLWHKGHDKAVVKISGTKAGIVLVELDKDAEVLKARLNASIDCWTFVRKEGLPGAFRVSPWIPMTYEYRFFVVDGEVVTGAGCIEEFTPLDHDPADGPFDPWVREHRGNGIAAGTDSAPVRRPGMVSWFLRRAREIAEMLPADGRTVQMDLAAVGEHDEPVLIEFNATPNSGLYACDSDLLHDALVDAKDRGYSHEAFLPGQGGRPAKERSELTELKTR